MGPQSSRGLEAAQPSASRKECCPPPRYSHLLWLSTIFPSFSLLPFLPLLPTPFSCLSSSSNLPPAFYGKKGNIFDALEKDLIFNIIDPPPPTPFPGCGTSGAERRELNCLLSSQPYHCGPHRVPWLMWLFISFHLSTPPPTPPPTGYHFKLCNICFCLWAFLQDIL